MRQQMLRTWFLSGRARIASEFVKCEKAKRGPDANESPATPMAGPSAAGRYLAKPFGKAQGPTIGNQGNLRRIA